MIEKLINSQYLGLYLNKNYLLLIHFILKLILRLVERIEPNFNAFVVKCDKLFFSQCFIENL